METIIRFSDLLRVFAGNRHTLTNALLDINLMLSWLRERAMTLLKRGRFNSNRRSMAFSSGLSVVLKSTEAVLSALKKITLRRGSVFCCVGHHGSRGVRPPGVPVYVLEECLSYGGGD